MGSSQRAVPLSPATGTFAAAVALGEHHTLVLTNSSEVLAPISPEPELEP